MVASTRSALVFSIALVVVACIGGDYEISLPNGYFIARVKPGDFGMVAPDRHTVIVRSVTAYRVDGNIVAGQMIGSAGAEPLYFVVDTRTNSTATALNSADWEQRLEVLGIRDRTLIEPKRP